MDFSGVAATRPAQEIGLPAAFLCSSSRQLMKDPVLSLCGHLFEKAFADLPENLCPIDKSKITQVFPVPTLKEAIAAWTAKETAASAISLASEGAASLALKPEAKSTARPLAWRTALPDAIKGTSHRALGGAVGAPLRGSPPSSLPRGCYQVMKNVHTDDIHGMIRIGDHNIVTGSKDTTCNIYTLNEGNSFVDTATKKVYISLPGYSYWVTALSKINDCGLWALGTRDGFLELRERRGESITSGTYSPPAIGKSKDRNLHRINCLSSASSDPDKIEFYSGTPRFVQLWSVSATAAGGKQLNLNWNIEASRNDWVYVVHPMNPSTLLVVIGTKLEKWDITDPSRKKVTPIFVPTSEEDRIGMGHQRPFISAICPRHPDQRQFAMSLFGGRIEVIDIESKARILTYFEHKQRVWMVENISEHTFVSGADDGLIKVWDDRQSASVRTLQGGPVKGRVSTLLKLAEHQFVSSSCPDDVYRSSEKATLACWDMRRLEAASGGK